MSQPTKMPRNQKQLFRNVILGLLFVLLLAFLFLPIPYYLEGPGSAEALDNFVKVNGKRDKDPGNYMLTTVGIRQATGMSLVIGHFQPFIETVSKTDLMGDESDETYLQMQKFYMEDSQNNAIIAAYDAANKEYKKKYLGIYVISILDNSTFKDVLQIGDTVTKLDGQSFKSSKGFINAVKAKKVGDQVKVTYTHNKKVKTATRKLMKLPDTNKPGLGITLTDHSKVTTKIPVKIDAGDIGGPSAGLMFTLQIYTQLTGKDLRDGREIAGTGTMDAKGNVGAIGGIDKKIVAADDENAVIFFAPDDPITKAIKKVDPTYQNNYAVAKNAAKQIKTKMKVIPVKTLQDAINYLKDHPK